MSLYTQLQVYLDGTFFNKIVNFSLEEKIGQHAVFSVSIRGDALENRLSGSTVLEQSRSFLGKPFYLEVSEGGRLNRETLYFKGKITEIKGKKGNEHG
ncbi:hypothetical protein [Aquimarina agarivorans]|uniref:hypothetical protein n=1 Tax=Aquimarina agarivorans TaxID=980584 RepID=UPI000248E5A2|nr:hypothetical protein [Aquimarina agarivorans]